MIPYSAPVSQDNLPILTRSERKNSQLADHRVDARIARIQKIFRPAKTPNRQAGGITANTDKRVLPFIRWGRRALCIRQPSVKEAHKIKETAGVSPKQPQNVLLTAPFLTLFGEPVCSSSNF
jgi:hypothetical protein